MIKDLIYTNRSYRRFLQHEKISMETLRELVDLARHSASSGNLQSLKYEETVQVEYIEAGGDIKYWRDENDVHHVPKRPLHEIIWREHQ